MMMAGQCTPHVVGRNSAAPFPAKAENSAQAPFLHLRPKSRPSGGWPPKRACGRSPLPTGPASLGSGGGPCFRLRRKEKTLQRALSPLRGSPWRAVHGPLRSPWRLCRLGLRRPPRGEKRKRLFGPCGSALHSSELLRKLDAWMQGHSSLPALRAWPMPWGMIRPPRPPALSVDCLRGPVP